MKVEEAEGGYGKSGKAGELGALEAQKEGAVVAAEIFEKEAEQGIEHDI